MTDKTRSFYSKVAGVTHSNPDGSSRQAIIQRFVKPRHELVIIQDTHNPVDPGALALYVKGKPGLLSKPRLYQIGYISSRVASELRLDLARGARLRVYARKVTGGKKQKETLGVNIEIFIDTTGV